MDVGEGGDTHVIELVSDDYFPSEVDERELQQQLSGNDDRDGGASPQVGVTTATWQKLEAYIHSDAAVSDLRSNTWISIPSAEVRRRRWRLVNCMLEQDPPIAISITDLPSFVKPNKAPFRVEPQEAAASTANDQAAQAPPHAAAASVPSASSTPLPSSSPTGSRNIRAANASQHGAPSPNAACDSENVTAGGSSQDVCVLSNEEVKANDWYSSMMARDAAETRNLTKRRLANAFYLPHGFTSSGFSLECRQLLEDVPMDTRVENWSVFVVVATLKFYQRQVHAWVTLLWTWRADLTGCSGSLLSHWLSTPSTTAPVNGSVFGMIENVTSATAEITAASTAASAVLAPLVSVVYAVRILVCVRHALGILLRAGQLVCAGHLRFEPSFPFPAKDSILWTLATNSVWRRQVEWMLASIAFLLVIVSVLVLMRYRKYTQALRLWEAQTARSTAAEAAKWASEMDARQRGVCAPLSADIHTGKPRRDSASDDNGRSIFKVSAISSALLSRRESFREELREKALRQASGSTPTRQDLPSRCVDMESEVTEGAAFSDLSPCCGAESSNSGTDNTLITKSSGEELQGSFRGCGAPAACDEDVVGGSAAMPSARLASFASVTTNLSFPRVIRKPLSRRDGGIRSSNDSGVVHSQLAGSPSTSRVLEPLNASDGPDSLTLS
ncbi:hypothetical protein, unknown function [Leishmania tarentolae]|uniref:Transmembrane protein n=1 Tax=Leishmania tarentolae TaxID=5689 RepID=A0A640KEU6_LEITA|nr:hypothetical protein, unknown function [Leishmania tarentolae]